MRVCANQVKRARAPTKTVPKRGFGRVMVLRLHIRPTHRVCGPAFAQSISTQTTESPIIHPESPRRAREKDRPASEEYALINRR